MISRNTKHQFKKIIVGFGLGLVLFTNLPGLSSVSAAQFLADGNDQLLVFSPSANSRISGTVITNWRVYDNNQAQIPYEISILDNARCSTKITSVASGTVASSTNNTSTTWNSAGSFPGVARLNDGSYCFQICVSLRNGNTPYSACDARSITIRNSNRAPVITTAAPNPQITTDQAYSFDVNATDPDGDPITYSLVSTPGFLSINSATGVISTNSNPKSAGSYTVSVQARDNWGSSASQNFTVRVAATNQPSTSSAITTTTTPALIDPTLSIIYPTRSSTLAGKQNNIRWQITNGASVKEIIISTTPENGTSQLVASLSPIATNFNWDVSTVKDGNYSLEILLKTNDGEEIRATTDRFSIQNNPTPGELLTKPLIIEISPSDGAEIRERRPTVSGKFTPPIGGAIDVTKFKFSIDDVDLTEICTVNPAEFKCNLNADLTPGVHKAKVEIQDFAGKLGEKDWTFTILDSNIVPETNQPGDGIYIGSQFIPRQSLIWALILCCAGVLLLLIPSMLISVWMRNRNRTEESTFSNTETVYDPYTYQFTDPNSTTPEVNVNYYYPTPSDPLNPGEVNSQAWQTTPSTTEVTSETVSSQPDVKTDIQPSADTSKDIVMPTPVETATNSDPLAPASATDFAAINPSAKSTTKTSNDPLAPASFDDLFSPKPVSTSSPSSNFDPNNGYSGYGYGSKVD